MTNENTIQEGDSKTVNGITVEIHEVTETEVYYARHQGDWWHCDGWPFYRKDRDDFERLWEAEI